MRYFLRECLQLLYWVFFKPTALRRHINLIAPGYEKRLLLIAERTRWGKLNVNLLELRDNWALRAFVLKSLVIELALPFLLYGAIGLTIAASGGHFSWQKSLASIAIIVVVAVMVGIVATLVAYVAHGLVFAIAVGVVLGPLAGIIFGVLSGIVSSGEEVALTDVVISIAVFLAVSGFAFGIVEGARESAVFAFSVGASIIVVMSIVGIVTGRFAFARTLIDGGAFLVTIVVLFGVGFTRLPIYLVEVAPTILGYRIAVRSNQFELQLLRSPVYVDEHIFFPQPYLSSLLFHLLQQDLKAGLTHISFVANHPSQGWAAQKAIKRLLENGQISFFFTRPVTYHS